jgi:hypothetical protein
MVVVATLKDGRSLAKATSSDVTIPIGGGSATSSLTTSDFGLRKIETIVHVRVIRKAPVVNDVYEPSAWVEPDGSAIGLSLFAGTGTTLAAEVVVAGF